MNFKELEIVGLTSELVKSLADNPADVAIKIAALRSAADLLQQAVLVQGFTASLANILLPRK